MDIAYEVATYLDNANFGTINSDIFVGQIPDSMNGIYVVRIGGQMNNYIPIEESVVDIYIKDTSAETAITTLENIKRYIHRMHTTEIHNAYVYTFLVMGDIESVQRDLEYAKIFKLTLQVVYRNTGLIS
jgi:hypothetical protein